MSSKHSIKWISAWMASGALVLGGATLAQAESMPKTDAPALDAESFTQIDANKDGMLTRQEAKAVGVDTKTFGAIDVDKDGKVSQKEYMEVGAPAAPTKPGSGY